MIIRILRPPQGKDWPFATTWDAVARNIEGLLRSITAPQNYTVATVPDATVNEGRMIYVSNEAGGAVIAFSDGTDWRRSTDRAVIS